MTKLILIYLAFINFLALITCLFDKKSAERGGWRVRERDLMLLSLLGGSVIMYMTMRIIHHKTRHNKFMVGIPIIIVLQAAALVALACF